MKKLFSFFLILSLLIPCVYAENIDLSALSFEELAALRDRCQTEMMQKDEWEYVVVPQGIWLVGKDIPAGDWIVKCYDYGRDKINMRIMCMQWGEGYPDQWGGGFYIENMKGNITIANQYSEYYEEYAKGKPTEYRIHVEDGQYIYIDDEFNAAVFLKEYSNPPFTFKKKHE